MQSSVRHNETTANLIICHEHKEPSTKLSDGFPSPTSQKEKKDGLVTFATQPSSFLRLHVALSTRRREGEEARTDLLSPSCYKNRLTRPLTSGPNLSPCLKEEVEHDMATMMQEGPCQVNETSAHTGWALVVVVVVAGRCMYGVQEAGCPSAIPFCGAEPRAPPSPCMHHGHMAWRRRRRRAWLSAPLLC